MLLVFTGCCAIFARVPDQARENLGSRGPNLVVWEHVTAAYVFIKVRQIPVPYTEGLLAQRPRCRATLIGCPQIIQCLPGYLPYLEAVCSICNPRTCHALAIRGTQQVIKNDIHRVTHGHVVTNRLYK